MPEHKFHKQIGEKIFNANLKDCIILRDTATFYGGAGEIGGKYL